MQIGEFDGVLDELGWKVADFCRMTGVHRNTPSRWRREGVPIPEWVPRYLDLTLELRRLYLRFAAPPDRRPEQVEDGPAGGQDAPENVPGAG